MLVVALAVVLAGCSFFSINGPPDGHRMGDPVVCDTDRLPIWFDIAAAFFGTLGAGGSAAEAAEKEGSPGGTKTTGGETAASIAAAMVFLVPFTASAFVGRSRVRRCQEAQGAFVGAQLRR